MYSSIQLSHCKLLEGSSFWFHKVLHVELQLAEFATVRTTNPKISKDVEHQEPFCKDTWINFAESLLLCVLGHLRSESAYSKDLSEIKLQFWKAVTN